MSSNPFWSHKGFNESSFTIDANFCQTFGTFWGRKEAEAGWHRLCTLHGSLDEARLDWNSYRQKWILIPSSPCSLDKCTQHTRGWDGGLSIERMKLSMHATLQCCNSCIYCFRATNIIDCKWAIGFENWDQLFNNINAGLCSWANEPLLSGHT